MYYQCLILTSCVIMAESFLIMPNDYQRRSKRLSSDAINRRGLIKRLSEQRLSFKECKLDPGERQDCGFFGMGETDCYKRGCCWGESSVEGVPWCYHSKPTIKPECAMDNGDRLECGFYGIRKDQCLASGCCWKPNNGDGVPWCFHVKRMPAFEGECGVPPISPTVAGRIVGGTGAKAHSWPWMASLQKGGKHFCGGSFINNRWVLTAAHCKPGFDFGSGDNTIEVGMHHMQERSAFQRTVRVEEIIPHEDYDDTNYDTDVMLLKLSESVDFEQTVQPVCLPEERHRVAVGTHCYSTGWGDLQFMGSDPESLQQVMIPILAEETCNQDEWYGGKITDNMLCAGYHEGGRDSCQGDSGGPLVCYVDEHWILYGVVSWGEGCASEAKPGLYARVSNFVDWIEQTLAKHQ